MLRTHRLQDPAVGVSGTGDSPATLMTDGAPITPAATSTASATTTDATAQAAAAAAAGADATQHTSTDDAAAAAAKADEAAKTAERVVPEKYELTAPEGVTLELESLGEFEGLAKELKLTQEEAQKVTDIGVRMTQKFAAQQAEAIQTAAAEWAASSSSDKEFGGDKLTENLAVSKKALDAFGTPELRTLLNDSRLGNHPEVIRFMYRAGKAISEDRMVTGGAGPATANTTTAKSLYPNQS